MKTFLTQQVVFEYASNKSNDNNRWDKYDLVLWAQSNLDSTSSETTIIEMTLDRLEIFGVNKNVCKFVESNMKKCKHILVILDGIDESVVCQQLDNRLNGTDNGIKWNFDLIVTQKQTTTAIRTAENVTFMEICGFSSKTTQCISIPTRLKRPSTFANSYH